MSLSFLSMRLQPEYPYQFRVVHAKEPISCRDGIQSFRPVFRVWQPVEKLPRRLVVVDFGKQSADFFDRELDVEGCCSAGGT